MKKSNFVIDKSITVETLIDVLSQIKDKSINVKIQTSDEADNNYCIKAIYYQQSLLRVSYLDEDETPDEVCIVIDYD